MSRCRHIKPSGEACRANAQHGSDFCFFHDPVRAGERAAAQAAGGRANARPRPTGAPLLVLESARDVTALLAQTINQVCRGEVDQKVANSVGYLANILLKAQEQAEFEGRLYALERALFRPEPTSSHDLTNVDHLVGRSRA